MILEEQVGKESKLSTWLFALWPLGLCVVWMPPEASRRGRTLLRTRRIICLTCVQPHIPKSMGKLKDGHRIFNLTRQMKGKPCSCHISLTGTLTVSYCLVSYTEDQAFWFWLSNFRIKLYYNLVFGIGDLLGFVGSDSNSKSRLPLWQQYFVKMHFLQKSGIS